MVDNNDEAAVKLFESLERQIGHLTPPFADIEDSGFIDDEATAIMLNLSQPSS